MATKNLARTVIEGGRTHHHKFERRRRTRRDRHRGRAVAALIARNPDDEGVFLPRQTLMRWHFDRLSAAERWLGSFVGQPWNSVRAQIARNFDTRTVAGRHIVFDHLLPSVRGSGSTRAHTVQFEIDRGGVLRACRTVWPYRAQRRDARRAARARADALLWLNGRRVGRRGAHLFWFESTGASECEPAFRQTRRLSRVQQHRWLQFPAEVRAALLMPLA